MVGESSHFFGLNACQHQHKHITGETSTLARTSLTQQTTVGNLPLYLIFLPLERSSNLKNNLTGLSNELFRKIALPTLKEDHLRRSGRFNVAQYKAMGKDAPQILV